MSKVIDMKGYVGNRAVERAQKLWKTRFPEELKSGTRLADLSDRTILTLAQLGQDITNIVYGLVMGVLGFGSVTKLDFLDGQSKMQVLDASLFLIDQFRWEVMARLGWTHGYAGEEHSLVEMILDCRSIKADFSPPFPLLRDTHPNYEEFMRRKNIDGESMLRSMIPAAMAAFNQIA
jgi:hypothetical protein